MGPSQVALSHLYPILPEKGGKQSLALCVVMAKAQENQLGCKRAWQHFGSATHTNISLAKLKVMVWGDVPSPGERTERLLLN